MKLSDGKMEQLSRDMERPDRKMEQLSRNMERTDKREMSIC